MPGFNLAATSNPLPVQPNCVNRPVADLRFRTLMGAKAWDNLPEAVKARFGKRLGPGQSVNYAGQVLECRRNLSGWILAQMCRVIGAPLPLEREGGVAAVVSVTEDGASGGQVWTRIYARKRGFPQVIHSVKRFAGTTGLEEYLGAGFGIALEVHAMPHGIRFESRRYFLQLGNRRLTIPRWIAPGHLTVEHEDIGDGRFTFTLALRHSLLREVLYQRSLFSDHA